MARIGSQSSLALTASKIEPVTNIGQLFEQMAIDWTLGSAKRRMLVATRSNQFISVDITKRWVHFEKPHEGDIPVSSGYYSMVGFVKFEAQREFRGLFEVSDSGDHCWWGAVLTQRGYDLAITGVVEDFRRLGGSFFDPVSHELEPPKLISASLRTISCDGVSL